ncbi:uncharacterized protein UV8b_04737 [Ustilaginoidea virens]|uniref:MIT domain-containing protein n=1 Tax=Ustilaginoidea virens TaxID=1159556 RepID=A0A8E5MI97_USTVR|nr:uncharacterized protein UV8b_04737 [Ustilaginoidea virens]QUC20496.1 hypothetical protein UV8b_04737 [Ustilaginoidea virens]
MVRALRHQFQHGFNRRTFQHLRPVQNPAHTVNSSLFCLHTLDPSAHQVIPTTSPQRLRKPSSSSASRTRLPRSSSLLPPPGAVAVAATTSDALTPVYSPSEAPLFSTEFSKRTIVLPDTPPNELETDSGPLCDTGASRTDLPELPALSFSPALSLGSPSRNFKARPCSLEVLPGGDASDTDASAASPGKTESAGSSDQEPKMTHEPVREPYSPNRSRSKSRNGKSSADLTKPRTGKPPSQKAMLSQALQKANTAVQLDNTQNFEGARQSYVDACELLQQVLLKTTANEDKKKLEAIRKTYAGRIDELDRMTPLQGAKNKELPAPPGSADAQVNGESAQVDVVEVEPSNPTLHHAKATGTQYNRQRHDLQNHSDISKATRLAADQPSLHSTFSRPSQKPRSPEDRWNDSILPPQPLISRRPSTPQKPRHERVASDERGNNDSNHSGAWAGSHDGTCHFLDGSQNSWLDPIDESDGSSNTSLHSRASSVLGGAHVRCLSGDTEADFENAMDAAIEAAYDEGYEPMGSGEYDANNGSEEMVSNALRKVQEAPEGDGQTEREAYAGEDERQPGSHQESGCFYDDELSSDEEERILEEMTRDYGVEDLMSEEQLKPGVPPRPGSRAQQAHTGNDGSERRMVPDSRSLAATADRSVVKQPQQQHFIPKSLGPSVPPPKQALPDLPLTRAPSAANTVRSRCLSGQNPKQLTIRTTQLEETAAASHEEPTQTKDVPNAETELDEVVGERPQTSRSTRKLTQCSIEPPAAEEVILGSPPSRRGQPDMEDSSAARTGSPKISRLRKNFSTSSLRSLKGRNMSLSNLDDASDMSPLTPSSSGHFGVARTHAVPPVPLPAVASLRDQMDAMNPASLYLLGDYIHMPTTPGSPNSAAADSPVALEPCPNDVMLRPFWLMRCLYQTLAHPRGGYLSTKLFIPREVWKVKAVKLKNVEDKVSNCDLLTAALLKLAKVDTCDADAVLEELQALEGILEQVQITLTRKLGNEVGVHGSGVLFKEASNVVEGDGAPAVPRTASVSGKSSSFSWRRLRSKNSNLGLGGAYNSRIAGAEGSPRESATMPSLPMTPQPTTRPPKRDISHAQFVGPNAHYMSSLARLFDAVQALDQIARQVDDPGLRHADKTQVGLELCTRHVSEFFGFYICRFVLSDLSLLLDKFVKRGSEWVLT